MVSPLVQTLGAAFFQSLPESPGVYFFHDCDDRLLYVGQSGNLKKRIGSYRFVSADRHPRRTLRLIRRVHRITWRLCDAAAEAIALESALLLELRPSYNRAGVWKAPPGWVRVSCQDGRLEVRLRMGEESEADESGPFRGGFRYAFPALVRVLHAALEKRYHPWDFPCGLTRATVGPEHAWNLSGDTGPWLGNLTDFLQKGDGSLLDSCRGILAEQTLTLAGLAWWEEQFEMLQPFVRKEMPGSPADA
ncbi:MAG: helicase UvrC [Verrucomicrobiales bacterium]|nr:helicase UvrC [Verrucomicrobiales bacterium]